MIISALSFVYLYIWYNIYVILYNIFLSFHDGMSYFLNKQLNWIMWAGTKYISCVVDHILSGKQTFKCPMIYLISPNRENENWHYDTRLVAELQKAATAKITLIASSWGQHGAHLGPTGPRWAPCWPREPCYLSTYHCHQWHSLCSCHHWFKCTYLYLIRLSKNLNMW